MMVCLGIGVDEGGAMRNVSIVTAITVLVGIGAWMVALGLGVDTACVAFRATPDVGDFGHFAYALDVSHQGKISYLFGPTIAAFLLGILFLLLRPTWFEKTRWGRLDTLPTFPVRAILIGVVAALFLVATHDHAHRAIVASQQSHWRADSQPNSAIDFICTPFRR